VRSAEFRRAQPRMVGVLTLLPAFAGKESEPPRTRTWNLGILGGFGRAFRPGLITRGTSLIAMSSCWAVTLSDGNYPNPPLQDYVY
jgi:hypothetical protein